MELSSRLAEGVLASFLAAILFAIVIYRTYARSASILGRDRLFASDLWWIPGWNCWRFIVPNMKGPANLWDIEYRCWLREIIPERTGCSVKSFRDIELDAQQRIILPTGQDLPILCFRFERRENNLVFLHTDKFGKVLCEVEIFGPNMWQLKAEYSFYTLAINASIRGKGNPKSSQTLLGRFVSHLKLPHRVHRLLTIPQKNKGRTRETDDIFESLFADQANPEHSVPIAFTGAEQVSIRLPD